MGTKRTDRQIIDIRHNHLLGALPPDDWQRWLPRLEPVEMPVGQVVFEPGQPLQHLYFPLDAIVSLFYELQAGTSAAIAMVGREGVLGSGLLMGVEAAPYRAVVQNAGRGVRMQASFLHEEFARGGPAMRLLLRYTQALISQMSQTAVCIRHHSLDQQVCRWMLLSLDRLGGVELAATLVHIAHLLGVGRSGVANATALLQQLGLIRYTRGHITVVDRPGLQQRSCECYRVVTGEYSRLLPPSLQLT